MAGLNPPLNRKLRMGLVGGGGNAFIGPVHATAARLDGRAELVAGALSSDPDKARRTAADFGIAPDRAYGSFTELIERERERPEQERIDFVSIATPNYLHYPVAKAALEAGFNVVCDKPLTVELGEAEELVQLVERTGAVLAVTHNYSAYPLVRQARDMVLNGELGEIIAVRVQYIQSSLWGWQPGQPPARGAWKADPKKMGRAGTLADIGTHAYHLARYSTGLMPEQVCCLLKTFHRVRPLDDYGQAMIRFEGGALGQVTFSQVTHGRPNDIRLEIDGTKRSLLWEQQEPNRLIVRAHGEPAQVYERHPSAAYASESERASCRLPAGHPEAFFEAFANIYCESFEHMIARACGQPFDYRYAIYPTVHDGAEAVYFVQQCLASSEAGGTWMPLKHPMARRWKN